MKGFNRSYERTHKGYREQAITPEWGWEFQKILAERDVRRAELALAVAKQALEDIELNPPIPAGLSAMAEQSAADAPAGKETHS